MKKIFTSAFLFFSVILISFGQEYRVKKLALVFNEGKESVKGIKTTLEIGTIVKLIKEHNGEFLFVGYNGVSSGYVAKKNLEGLNAVIDSTYYTVNAERSLIYGEANRNSKTDVVTSNDRLLFVQDYGDGWVGVQYKKKHYYILRGQLKNYKLPETTNTTTIQSSETTYPSSNTIHTGPRGGRYYINSNGNKTYIKK